MIVAGEKERNAHSISLRTRAKEGAFETMKVEDFIAKIKKEVREKR